MKFLAIFWGLFTGLSFILCINVLFSDVSIQQSIICGSFFIASSIYFSALTRD